LPDDPDQPIRLSRKSGPSASKKRKTYGTLIYLTNLISPFAYQENQVHPRPKKKEKPMGR
jgi:hypothetical protein